MHMYATVLLKDNYLFTYYLECFHPFLGYDVGDAVVITYCISWRFVLFYSIT